MSMLSGGGSSSSNDNRSCLFCCHDKIMHSECKRIRTKFEKHHYVGINKMGRYVRLPSEGINENWRRVVVAGFDLSTRARIREGSNYRTAAHHILV